MAITGTGLGDGPKKNEETVNNTDNGIFESETREAEPLPNGVHGQYTDPMRNESPINTTTELGIEYFITPNRSSEYLSKFIELTKNMNLDINNKKVKAKTTVFQFDRANSMFSNLAYSYIVLATQPEGSKDTYFHILLLEATGDAPREASQILDEFTSRNNIGPSPLFVASDAFDPVLIDLVHEVLTESLEITIEDLISTNGLVVPYDQKPEDIAERSLIFGLNANIARLVEDLGVVGVLDLQKYVRSANDKVVVLDVTYIGDKAINAMNQPIRSDFSLAIRQEPSRRQGKWLNSMASSIELLTASGYTEYLPVEKQVGYDRIERKITPLIIINDNYSVKPTLDMTVLSLISSTVFSNQAQLANLLLHSKSDLGSLNYITNIENSKKGHGQKIKLNDGKVSKDKVLEDISRMFNTEPIVAIETLLYGPNFDAQSTFAALNDPTLRAAANDVIVETVEAMLGTKLNYTNVSVDEGIIVPVGVWEDRNGVVRDIRSDLAFILEHTNDDDLIYKWVRSNAPMSQTGIDPYLAKLEVIAAIIPNAIITGKAARLIIDSAFLAEVANIASSIGFNPRLDKDINVGFRQYNDLYQIASKYANQGLQGVSFGQTGFSGNAYATPHLNLYGYWHTS